jgi:hypothetical protein
MDRQASWSDEENELLFGSWLCQEVFAFSSKQSKYSSQSIYRAQITSCCRMEVRRSIFLWIPSIMPTSDLIGVLWCEAYLKGHKSFVMESHFPQRGSNGTVWYRLKRQTNYWVPDKSHLRKEFHEWRWRKIQQTQTLKKLEEEGKVKVKDWDDESRPPPGVPDLQSPGGRLTGHKFGKVTNACVLLEHESARPIGGYSGTSLSYNSWGSQVLSDQARIDYSPYPSSQYAGYLNPLIPKTQSASHQLYPQQSYSYGFPREPYEYIFPGNQSSYWTGVASANAYDAQPQRFVTNTSCWDGIRGPYDAQASSYRGQSVFTESHASIGTAAPIEEELRVESVIPSEAQNQSLKGTIDSGKVESGTTRSATPTIVSSAAYSADRV